MTNVIKEKIFKAYDIRGIYPEDINESIAFEISGCLTKIFKPGKIVVAFDARKGSPEIAKSVEEGLKKSFQKAGMKVEVIFAGLSTTPMFYFLVNHFNATGGVMVTASHNPKEYNGLKVVGPKAIPVSGFDVKKTMLEN